MLKFLTTEKYSELFQWRICEDTTGLEFLSIVMVFDNPSFSLSSAEEASNAEVAGRSRDWKIKYCYWDL